MSRYEYKDDKSHKFWEIALDGDSYTVSYGRVGTAGQTKTTAFADAEAARAAAAKIAAQKVKKGYVEIVEASTLDADTLREWLGKRTMTIVKFQDYETTFAADFNFAGWLHTTDDDERCRALSDLGQTGTGSRIAVWHRSQAADAVVYLGSEGGRGVLAANLTDWVAAVALGIEFGGYPGDSCYLFNEACPKFEEYDEDFMDPERDPEAAQAQFRDDATKRFGPLRDFDAIVADAAKLNDEFALFVGE